MLYHGGEILLRRKEGKGWPKDLRVVGRGMVLLIDSVSSSRD